MKIPIINKMKFYTHKGKRLTPLTEAEARSLDKGDLIKYIGPDIGVPRSWSSSSSFDEEPFGYLGRRVRRLRSRPEVFNKKDPRQFYLRVSYYGSKLCSKIEHFALIQHGDPHVLDLNKALRLVPEHLYSFKRSIEDSVARSKKKIDKYLNTLPIHKRMEVFKALTKDQQLIYDFLSSGFEGEILQEKDVN
jgi:hypothetical protein